MFVLFASITKKHNENIAIQAPTSPSKFKSATIILLHFLNIEQVELLLQLSCWCVFILFIDVSNLICNSLYERMKSMQTDF